MMKCRLCVLVFLIYRPLATLALEINPAVLMEWNNFKEVHGKRYKNEVEEHFRMLVWKRNVDHIAEHNLRYYQANLTFRLAMNVFGDLLPREFLSLYSGTLRRNHKFITVIEPTIDTGNKTVFASTTSGLDVDDGVSIPAAIDWRNRGAVTAVKRQGVCGACWAFAATGALEGQLFIKTGKLVSLSEQNLLDCVKSKYVNGCHGGIMDEAFLYIRNNGGIDTEANYPYEEKKGKCRYSPADSAVTVEGFHDIPNKDEDALKMAVALVGPVAAGIDASHPNFQFYSDGIYRQKYCLEENLNHGVLVVGYGTSRSGEDFWLIKNSWGSEWGMDGYFKLARNAGNMCGITAEATFPILRHKLYPNSVLENGITNLESE